MSQKRSTARRRFIQGMLASCVLAILPAGVSFAALQLESIHFLIAGGGSGGTALGASEALTKPGLMEKASCQNMSGGGGGKAIGRYLERRRLLKRDAKNSYLADGDHKTGPPYQLVSFSIT